jgi:hypothetical protein
MKNEDKMARKQIARERAFVIKVFAQESKQRSTTSEAPLDLQNLPFDPAQTAWDIAEALALEAQQLSEETAKKE